MAHHGHTPRLCDHCAGPLTAAGRCTQLHTRRLAWMLDSIQHHRQATAQLIREYCRAQVSLWRLVPWLALLADGRSGYLDDTHHACAGFWPIPVGYPSSHRAWVDLEIGELVTYQGAHLISDESLLRLDPSRLDAAAVLEGLRRRAKQPDNPEAQTWRANMSARHRLTPNAPFRRRPKCVAVNTQRHGQPAITGADQ